MFTNEIVGKSQLDLINVFILPNELENLLGLIGINAGGFCFLYSSIRKFLIATQIVVSYTNLNNDNIHFL